MKKFFNERQILKNHATENPHRPIYNNLPPGYIGQAPSILGYENHDITLYFEPIDKDMADALRLLASSEEEPKQTRVRSEDGVLEIQTGADEITWGYGMNTKRYPTYGGEVVQILSTYAEKMTIRGTCQNYKELTRIYEFFKEYIFYTTGGASVVNAGNTERKQKYLKLFYPARRWSFVIMVTDISNFRMARDVAAPEWEITAEIVSENDRNRLGSERVDRFASVLSKPVAMGRRGAVRSSDEETTDAGVRLAKNFDIERNGEVFGNQMDFANGKRGKVAENFHALVASWATGDITTPVNNPIVEPEKTEQQIWDSQFGSGGVAAGIGSSGTTTGSGSESGAPLETAPTVGDIVWGKKTRVFATSFGGSGDPTAGSTGHAGGQAFDLNEFPDSYAELSTNMYNSANGKPADGKNNDYAALGGLDALTPIKVTYNGKSKILYKRDVGFGGNGPDKKRGTDDDPKIDLWHAAAKELGFNGWDWVEIEIGVGSLSGNVEVVMTSSRKEALSIIKRGINTGVVIVDHANDRAGLLSEKGVIVGHESRGHSGDKVVISTDLLKCVASLIKYAQTKGWSFNISSMVGSHSRCVGGGDYPGCRQSRHWTGFGCDIYMINGKSLDTAAAKNYTVSFMKALNAMSPKPNQIIMYGNGREDSDVNQYELNGSINGPKGYDADTHAAHDDHIHIGY